MKFSENIKIDDLLENLCKKVIQLNKKKEKNAIEKIFEKIIKSFSKSKFNKEERRIIRNIIREIDGYKTSDKANNFYVVYPEFKVSAIVNDADKTVKAGEEFEVYITVTGGDYTNAG